MLPELTFSFHDAVIASGHVGPRREVVLRIDMYPILYPERPTVELRFGGIFNFDTTSRFFRSILEESDDDYCGCRIDLLQYDTKKSSTEPMSVVHTRPVSGMRNSCSWAACSSGRREGSVSCSGFSVGRLVP